jgi:hypothetical protein
MFMIRLKLVAGLLLVAGMLLPGLARADTLVEPYVTSIGPDYDVDALFSVNDAVRETSNPSLQYRMVGIPDGLGAHGMGHNRVALYMNHEFTQSTLSEPVIGGPLNRGAFVSRWTARGNGEVVSGERAYDRVYQENAFIGPAAQADNSTPGFGRFCSGSLAGRAEGLDRPIYFTNEEADPPATFDPLGGQSVAIFDNEAHTLPRLGHFAKENTLVMPNTGRLTVVISLEDGPSTPDSQLYMYVGWKDGRHGATVLGRNGLDNGKLYVFAGLDATKNAELDLPSGRTLGRWLEIPNAQGLSAAQLEEAADAAGAFSFVRLEDGAFSKTDSRDFFFVTTGGNAAAGNELGRLYHLRLGWLDPRLPARLSVVYNADQIIANGGDIAISPDNIDTSEDYLVINEDGTTQSRAVMASKGRDGSIWRFRLRNHHHGNPVDAASARRIVELDPPGRDGTAVGPGVWETSGIIDVSALFGDGAWLTDVQAHSPTSAPASNTVEDGQLLLLTPDD